MFRGKIAESSQKLDFLVFRSFMVYHARHHKVIIGLSDDSVEFQIWSYASMYIVLNKCSN